MLERAQVDVIVVGAGVAGAAFAARMGALGKRVLILDRHEEAPNTIAGELLQPGGVQALGRLGLSDCIEGIEAQPVWGFAVIDGERQQALTYPKPASPEGVPEVAATQGASFHHNRFVGRLREAFLDSPHVTFVQGLVQELLMEDGRVCGVVMKAGRDGVRELRAPLTVLACGRNTRLMAPLQRQHSPHRIAYSVGIELKGAQLPFQHHGHVFFTSPSPSLGYQIDDDTIRMLIDFPQVLPKRANGDLAEHLREEVCPQLPVSLQGPFLDAIARDDIQSMQSLSLLPETPKIGGVALLGDALNMRHPLTGGGMTVALNDVDCLSSRLDQIDFAAGVSPETIDDALRNFYKQREPMAATIDMLSGALYEIFKATDPGLVLMRDAVMRYWQLGGMAVAGPMALLAGLRPSPLHLLLHYCAVALLGVGTHMAPEQKEGKHHPFHLPRFHDLKESTRLLKAAVGTLGQQVQRGLKLLNY